ncbi:N-lysine methyltransferase setd6 isoform X2 [Macadamia integrifolia]|uniref:N-lysine methyltransferase setd6 isoform X2 n=1 Tax=Macadamia integrifolia TaxID=60698 RepID=UPI001C4F84FD|nr:N-lysine methyltransferase setd6 isoform X2 [Macadamia integrifolia]
MSRRLRAFRRWMRSQGIECSNALEIIDGGYEQGFSVKALCGLAEGDLVATIPKSACLTIQTSAARDIIEDAGLAGLLGLAVALMYEKSLGEASAWAGYLQLLPDRECVPLVWTLDELDSLLYGTELHKAVKEDKNLFYEDWKECILPLIANGPFKLNPNCFGVEQYFAARSLISSRSFEIDDYHGSGMVPLADLDNDLEDNRDGSCINKLSTEDHHFRENTSSSSLSGKYSLNDNHVGYSPNYEDDPTALEIIIVKAVEAGAEVFNTYGSMGNAALLHRYGFTEPDNPFDIVNIELDTVLEWTKSLYSSRYVRARLSLWRRLRFSGCVGLTSEYFEISSDGKPQLDLLILLYFIFLTEEAYHKLNQMLPSFGNISEAIPIILLETNNLKFPPETPEVGNELLLTDMVREALKSLADIRESFYGESIEDDIEVLKRGCLMLERKLYHSLTLRMSETRIIQKLRAYASPASRRTKRTYTRKR